MVHGECCFVGVEWLAVRGVMSGGCCLAVGVAADGASGPSSWDSALHTNGLAMAASISLLPCVTLYTSQSLSARSYAPNPLPSFSSSSFAAVVARCSMLSSPYGVMLRSLVEFVVVVVAVVSLLF